MFVRQVHSLLTRTSNLWFLMFVGSFNFCANASAETEAERNPHAQQIAQHSSDSWGFIALYCNCGLTTIVKHVEKRVESEDSSSIVKPLRRSIESHFRRKISQQDDYSLVARNGILEWWFKLSQQTLSLKLRNIFRPLTFSLSIRRKRFIKQLWNSSAFFLITLRLNLKPSKHNDDEKWWHNISHSRPRPRNHAAIN